MILLLEEVNISVDFMAERVLHLEDEHVAEFFFPPQEIVFGGSVCKLSAIDGELFDGGGVPLVHVFEEKDGAGADDLTVVDMRGNRIRIGNTVKIMGMVTSQLRLNVCLVDFGPIGWQRSLIHRISDDWGRDCGRFGVFDETEHGGLNSNQQANHHEK